LTHLSNPKYRYKRRRPFHPARFSQFLQGLGKLSISGIKEVADEVSSMPVDGGDLGRQLENSTLRE